MTVRVTTLKGADAGAYYVEQLPNYYLQSGEPRGIWLGDGAQLLGLSGEIDDDAFIALMGGLDPARPDRHLGRAYDDRSVRGFDVTCSAPKSVSVLFALGDLDTRREVLAAHDAAVAAVAGWIERRAHTRYRIGGEVAIVDAEGIVAAAFRQHTSRALDPQLHTHLVIPNRVKSPDDRWLALDARLIKHDQQSLSAMYHAALRSELTYRLGVRWNVPEHGISEISDVPDEILAEFSSRTGDVRRRIDAKLDRFLETMGREPTSRERWRLEREAAIDSRPAKAHSLDAAVLHEQWAEQVRTLGHEPAQVSTDALGRLATPTGIERSTARAIVDQAVATMSERQSTWRPTQLHREIGAAIPTETGIDADRLVRWIDRVVDDTTESRCIDLSAPIPKDALLRNDGRPVSESVLDRALTTQAILDQEADLIAWADHRLAYDGADNPDATARSTVELNSAQGQAAAAVAGSDDLVLIVGPAGTGKTTALAPAVAQLRADGRAVFGVAPSATAAEVLAAETGVQADTLDKLLIEHRLNRPPERRYDLAVGTTVIVDEAGMMSTAKLAELADLADTKGWRVALVGDPLQFSAVGRGGMFGLLVDTFGAVEFDRVHRFDNDWERDASLRLRRGDVEVGETYEENGRLHGGTQTQMERASVARWWELRQQGKSQLLMTPTNEATERLNQRCQQNRIRAGEIDPTGPFVTAGPYTLHVGDEIATRHNDRRLTTDTGDMVRNRATWTIDAVTPDGSLTATGRSGTVHLPPAYVVEHVELAYARTCIAGQGRTVKAGLLFMDVTTDVRNVYVAMTRGTETNEAFVVTTGEQTALDVLTQSIATDWIDLPAHTRRDELQQTTSNHRPGLLDGLVLRQVMEERHEIIRALTNAERKVTVAPSERSNAQRDTAQAQQRISDAESALIRAQATLDRCDRTLHRHRHATEIDSARQDVARLPGVIADGRTAVAKTTTRLRQLDVDQHDANELLRRRPNLEAKVAELDDRLDADLRRRTRIARLEQPSAIVDVVGARPSPGATARAWDHAAGRLHQHQAAFGLDAGVGPRPGLLDNGAYTDSRNLVERELEATVQVPQYRARRIEPPGLSL
ncbi:MAG: MobF family relaxase [Actinomycetota bacterium]|nr:MobF family relaxase [Actinomycetota bacterium]